MTTKQAADQRSRTLSIQAGEDLFGLFTCLDDNAGSILHRAS